MASVIVVILFIVSVVVKIIKTEKPEKIHHKFPKINTCFLSIITLSYYIETNHKF